MRALLAGMGWLLAAILAICLSWTIARFKRTTEHDQFTGRCQHCRRPMPPDLLVKDETGEATCIWCA